MFFSPHIGLVGLVVHVHIGLVGLVGLVVHVHIGLVGLVGLVGLASKEFH